MKAFPYETETVSHFVIAPCLNIGLQPEQIGGGGEHSIKMKRREEICRILEEKKRKLTSGLRLAVVFGASVQAVNNYVKIN